MHYYVVIKVLTQYPNVRLKCLFFGNSLEFFQGIYTLPKLTNMSMVFHAYKIDSKKILIFFRIYCVYGWMK